MNVGVRELKQHLSAYLERAADGERIQVTEHGRPKAMLIAVPEAALFADGVAQGWLRRGCDVPADPVPRARARVSIATARGEDRGT